MNSQIIKGSATIAAIAILAGCSNMTAGENAATFGALSGVTAGAIGSAAGLSNSEATALGLGVGALTAAIVYTSIRASERQKEVAAARARAYYASIPTAKKAEVRKKRYIAVNTEKDDRIKGQKAVMVYDTQSEKIVGNNVYDVQKAPAVGSTAKFDTYNAEYVGNGAS